MSLTTSDDDQRVLLGARLRHLREDRGLSQAELARRLAISPSYLNQIEHDRRPLTVAVLLRLTELFGVDPDFFSGHDAARLVAELREALLYDGIGDAVPTSEISKLATTMPALARAVIGLQRRHRDMVERASAVVGGLGEDAAPLASMPHEQVRDFLCDRNNHIPPLDAAGETLAARLGGGDTRAKLVAHLRDAHAIRVLSQPPDAPAGELRRYDPDARVLWLSNHLRPGQQAFQIAAQVALLEHRELLDELTSGGELHSPAAVTLALVGLANYFAASVLMPYAAFHAAAEDARYDVEQLADRFGVGFEVVCHRLSTLQRAGLRGVPFAFVRVDRAGNMSKRQSATGFHFSRGGGTCPLWSVYEAFSTPGRILRQVAEMPDGRTYFWIARTVGRKRTGYGRATKTFAIGLGCELRHAGRLVYSDGLALDDRRAITPIGMGCKTCERAGCPQRAFPAVGRHLVVDENRSTFEPYALLADR